MKKKQLKVNTFHFVHEGSKGGHPGLIYWINEEHNLYLLITFGSSETNNRHFIKLKHPISKAVQSSFVHKKPLLAKRRDISSDKLKDIKLSIEDYEIIIHISKKEPRTTSSVKRKDKWIFKLIKKKENKDKK